MAAIKQRTTHSVLSVPRRSLRTVSTPACSHTHTCISMKTISEAEGEQSAQFLSSLFFFFYEQSLVIVVTISGLVWMNFVIQRMFYRSLRIYELQCKLQLQVSGSIKSIKHWLVCMHGHTVILANTPGRSFQKWGTRLHHPFSHLCPCLTANGLSKGPIAESLCNCVIRFHTFQSSNPMHMCRAR